MSLTPAAVVAGYVAVHFLVGLRRGNVRKHFIGASEIEVITRVDPRLAFQTLKQIDRPFRVDDSDPETLRMVLSSRMTVFTSGFLYPVEIEATDGGSKITVGVRARALFGGMLATSNALERCARAIERLFAMPPARLA